MKPITRRTLARRVKRARNEMDWTQVELGQAASIHPTAISHIEAARRMPDLDKMIRLSKALERTTDWLLGL